MPVFYLIGFMLGLCLSLAGLIWLIAEAYRWWRIASREQRAARRKREITGEL